MRNNKASDMKIGIPVLQHTDDPQNDQMWTTFYGNLVHPDYSHPVFFRPNNQNVHLFNWYNGDTVYIIARGPSIGKYLEDKETCKLLSHPSICKFGMNSSPEIIDYNVNLWAGVDKLTKFPAAIYKNPNIMKFVPMNRFQVMNDGSKNQDRDKAVAYKDGQNVYIGHCPNVCGIQTFLLEQHPNTRMNFSSAYLGSTACLYGYYKGMKSVFLFTLKTCILLGFKKIVLLGVDFTMSNDQPYYKQTASDYQGFHVDHNNKLYTTLSPLIKDIYKCLESGESGYKTKIVTATPIASMPFIESINLKRELKDEIDRKS